MKTRTGENIGVKLIDRNGNSKELTEEEFSFLFIHEGGSVRKIIMASAARLDLRSFYLLTVLFSKRYFTHKNEENEKRELMDRLVGFEPESAEIRFNGKSITLKEFHNVRAFVKCIFVNNQYDANERNIGGRVVVDGGAHVGMFSLMAAMLGAKKVYAFEPVGVTFELLKRNVDGNGMQSQVIAVKKALGDKNETKTIYFTGATNGYSSFNHSENAESQNVEIVRLDDFLNGEEVGFIKLDTEGWEEAVLMGTEKSIRKSGPVLSFAAYHKPEDKQRLPEVVKSINPEYRIKLNSFSEEDFYCELPVR